MGKGEETKQAILEAALGMASRVGLEGLTIGSVARQADMSKSGLFAHFGSKEDLQIQVLDTAASRFQKDVIEPVVKLPRGVPRIRGFFDLWLAWESSQKLPGGCPFIAAANELDDRPGPVRDRLVGYQRQWLEKLSLAAQIAIGEGHFRADADPEQIAYELYAVILAYHHFNRLLECEAAAERARQAFDDLIRLHSPPELHSPTKSRT